ncbi:MAG: hypothetical protein Q9159_002517 [Coniocarpon cinnabarinum]
MVRSLQLDADDEPRRLGATSRANSVRFDESANQGQWAHASRTSMDISRTSTGLPGLGHPLFERTTSHKSDGRHSSAGQSALSGRANSFGQDSNAALSTAPMPPPGLAPGFFILGSVPSIIRCWLTANFKHDTLLYAAVCTGSYKSFLDSHLIEDLGLSDHIGQDINGDYKIKVPMYLPEAIPHPASSRSSSPAPPLPTITVDFTVVDYGEQHATSKAIRVFLGSDLLRAHNADVLFSTNTLACFDDERTKLSVPLVRPEDDATFKSLYITSGTPAQFSLRSPHGEAPGPQIKSPSGKEVRNGDIHRSNAEPEGASKAMDSPESPLPGVDEGSGANMSERSTPDPKASMRVQDHDGKPPLGRLSTEHKSDEKEVGEPTSSTTSASRTGSSSSIWNNNWRRDGSTSTSQTAPSDWASISRTSSRSTFSARTNRDSGIKVLKPTRTLSRTSNVTQSATAASPSSTGQSRFFDDGKRRNGEGAPPRSATMPEPPPDVQKRATSIDLSSKAGSKENPPATGNKPRSVNPIGGASAFGWLNSGLSSGGQEK